MKEGGKVFHHFPVNCQLYSASGFIIDQDAAVH